MSDPCGENGSRPAIGVRRLSRARPLRVLTQNAAYTAVVCAESLYRPFPPERFDRLRAKAAAAIAELKAAMEKGQ